MRNTPLNRQMSLYGVFVESLTVTPQDLQGLLKVTALRLPLFTRYVGSVKAEEASGGGFSRQWGHRCRRAVEDLRPSGGKGAPAAPYSSFLTRALKKTGCTAAVRDVSFDVAQGRGLRRHGPVGLRQVHARALSDPADRADRGRDLHRRRGRPRHGHEPAARTAPPPGSMVFQHFGLLPHRTVLDNVAYGLEIQGVGKRRTRTRGRRRSSPRSAWTAWSNR